MTGWLREFRILPIVLIAAGALLALKTFGLVFDGGFTLGQRLGRDRDNSITVTTLPATPRIELRSPSRPLETAAVPGPKRSWMQEMFNYPGGDVTGSVAATKPADKEAADKAASKKPGPAEPPPDKGGTVIAVDQPRPTSAGERALLERLQERRQELDARARELDMREGMLKAAEKKVETEPGVAQKAEAAKAGPDAQRREETENARFKAVVTMYETMKPKDAAKIFDRLDIKVLLEMASQIKPQRMSEILANMSPETAERLTVELTAKSGVDRGLNPASLPKIDGRPGGS
jgi:flagellar motility protein MotE (MotC chaperone)